MNNFLEGMSKEQLELADKILHIVSPFIIAAVIVVLVVPYFISRKCKKEIIRKSEENNTFVTARLVKTECTYDTEGNAGFGYRGIYEFTVNGETKKRRILFNGLPPEEIRLYPKNENSTKFFSDTGYDGMAWVAAPLIGLAVVIVIILLAMLDMRLEYLIN